MYAQISTFPIRSATITHVVRGFAQRVLPEARKLSGFLDADLFTRSRLGKGVAVFYWDTEYDARRARENGAFDRLWEPLSPYLLGPAETEGYEPNVLRLGSVHRELANEQTVRRANEAFSRKDLDALLACYADDAVQYEPFLDEPVAGKQALRQYFEGSFQYFPDEQIEIESLLSVGKRVVGQWVCRGTQTGEFIGLAPTGRRFEVPECGVYEFREDGLVQNLWVYVDSGTIAKQLGFRWVAEDS